MSSTAPSTPANARAHSKQTRLTQSDRQRRNTITNASPQTPYTPNSNSTFDSDLLDTPNSVGVRTIDKPLADVAINWRTRAGENGIRVSTDDDESPFIERGDATQELSAPFHAMQYRVRAQSMTTAPRAAVPIRQPLTPQQRQRQSPVARRTLAPITPHFVNANSLSTPPPKRQPQEQRSWTDPVSRRKPQALFAQNASMLNFGADLFAIDENGVADDEHSFFNEDTFNTYEDGEYPALQYRHSLQDPFYSTNTERSFTQHHSHSSLTSIAECDVEDKPFSFDMADEDDRDLERRFHASANPNLYAQHLPLHSRSMSASVSFRPHLPPLEAHSQSLQYEQGYYPHHLQVDDSQFEASYTEFENGMSFSTDDANEFELLGPAVHIGRSSSPPPRQEATPLSIGEESDSAPSNCSTCARSPRRLAILSPCLHALCPSCLTSALNIVGEKDMECAVCKAGVADFKLVGVVDLGGPDEQPVEDQSFKDSEKENHSPVLASPAPIHGNKRGVLAPSADTSNAIFDGHEENFAFDSSLELFAAVGIVRSSTPVGPSTPAKSKTAKRAKTRTENVVLRIDNVPWDITPPTISAWLQQPIEHVHVLLDPKGKTLSHAFVEVCSEEVAQAILRGEGRGSVLGKGKRARGVTVTRSGQEELMRALFPAWRGAFDGSRPSLKGLDNIRVANTFEHGLMTEAEMGALLHLIRSPDSHFLKAPRLPFDSLVSILTKFPADGDSRVFWSSGLRDMLYDVSYAAIQVLIIRTSAAPFSGMGQEKALLAEVIKSAIACKAFTTQQINQFSNMRANDRINANRNRPPSL